VRIVFSLLFIFIAVNIFAAPLESGYALAPKPTASSEEKARAYYDARQSVIEASKKYEGTPYRYGGITNKGLDCSGFIYLSFKDALGVTVPRSTNGLHSWAEKISFDDAQPGDLIFFKTDRSGNITHVGLYLGERRFIHSASQGEKRGVIYSSLDEKYWAKALAGAGRAFPETPPNFNIDNTSMAGNPKANRQKNKQRGTKKTTAGIKTENSKTRLLAGVAFAPIFNISTNDGDLFCGFTSQLSFSIDMNPIGSRMVIGLELRPEYDGGLEVFRLPITLSLGTNYKFRIFAGPVLCFGDTALTIDGNQNRNSGGTNWFGVIGVTAAPFIVKTKGGEFAPYIEASWQSGFIDNKFDFNSDFLSGFHLSTGIRWLINIS